MRRMSDPARGRNPQARGPEGCGAGGAPCLTADAAALDRPDPAERLALRQATREGVLAGLPFMFSVIPFGMLFGAIAAGAGLDPLKAMTLTTVVIAGAAQFAFVQLLADGAPVIVAIGAALAINLRMAMYSASLAPHIGKAPWGVRMAAGFFVVDQVYGLAMRRWAKIPHEPLPAKLGFYFGVALPISCVWVLSSALGLAVGDLLPAWLPLDFVPPAMFLAIVAPMIRGTANIAAAITASVFALLFSGLPWNLGLIGAAAIGMGVGAFVEIRLARRENA